MQIVEISEPGASEAPEEIVVGIDFGTTNSLIAYSKNHNPQIIGGDLGLVPSVIFYDDLSDNFIIGEHRGQKGGISTLKRLLAKSYEDIQSTPTLQKILSEFPVIDSDSVPKITFKNNDYSFSQLASKIFAHLKKHAQQELGTPVTKAVVSVPAYFDDASRGAVLLAAKIAGFEVLRLIAEPTAAAYAYGFHKKSKGSYMVYDLGGGTFDVSILTMQTGILQVVATGGDNLLGGDDIDYILAEYLAKELKTEVNSELCLRAKYIKESLSYFQEGGKNVRAGFLSVSEGYSSKSQDYSSSDCDKTLLKELDPSLTLRIDDHHLGITNEIFEKLIRPFVDKTIKIAKETLLDADIKLDGIILVGGATRMPIIARTLSETFGVGVFSDIDPDKAVVIGAALQAENLSSSNLQGSLLIDVTPLSLGLELYGGMAEKIIMRNTTIPFSVTKNFTTHVDNQTGMQFHIVQGEREMVKDCRSLAQFELKNIPPMKAGMAQIEVNFAIDADGILSVTARENESGQVQNIEIKPSYGMDEKEVNTMLESAFKNAEKDYNNRLLVETKLEAESLIFGLEKALYETPDILDDEQKKQIVDAINSLQKTITSGNRDDVLNKIKALNKLATNFIQQHLDKGALWQLKGKHVDEV
mgnify:CR=1 FL=1